MKNDEQKFLIIHIAIINSFFFFYEKKSIYAFKRIINYKYIIRILLIKTLVEFNLEGHQVTARLTERERGGDSLSE